MTSALDPVTMTRGLNELGVSLTELQAVDRLPLAQAQEALASLKDRVRQNFRRLSKELHPDTNGGDPAKTERFKTLAIVKSEFDKLTIRERPRVPAIPTPVMSQPMGVMWINPMGRPEIGIVGVPIAVRSTRRRNGV